MKRTELINNIVWNSMFLILVIAIMIMIISHAWFLYEQINFFLLCSAIVAIIYFLAGSALIVKQIYQDFKKLKNE